MTRYLLLLIFSPLLLLVGCSEEDDSLVEDDTIEQEDPHSQDVYYVHYLGRNSSALHKTTPGPFYYVDEYGNGVHMENSRLLDITIGPVSYGFRAILSNNRHTLSYAKIEVSKNNGPFVLKSNENAYASYTIDF